MPELSHCRELFGDVTRVEFPQMGILKWGIRFFQLGVGDQGGTMVVMSRSPENPIAKFLAHPGVLILDGGLATALESRGFDLNHELWSARVLMEAPEAIRQVHLDYLAAGADCLTTSSYQASIPGFRKHGLGEDEAIALLRRSVLLAMEARDLFWKGRDDGWDRQWPLVAASIGPYGAFLADGSEYTGSYDVNDDALDTFHRRRWEILAGSPADLLACETIPSRREAEVLLRLLRETPGTWAWMSFSCRDGVHLNDGTPVVDLARVCDAESRVAAVGINCTSPEYISSLISEVRKGTGKPIIVYPNSGDRYDASSRTWTTGGGHLDLAEACTEWVRLGATCIGGCCRVGTNEIAGLRENLIA